MEGTTYGDVPLNAELKLEVWDSPNSAGVITDAIRCLKLGLDRGLKGTLVAPSSYFMKSPPQQIHDDIAFNRVEAFIRGEDNETLVGTEAPAKRTLASCAVPKAPREAARRAERRRPTARVTGRASGRLEAPAPPTRSPDSRLAREGGASSRYRAGVWPSWRSCPVRSPAAIVSGLSQAVVPARGRTKRRWSNANFAHVLGPAARRPSGPRGWPSRRIARTRATSSS